MLEIIIFFIFYNKYLRSDVILTFVVWTTGFYENNYSSNFL